MEDIRLNIEKLKKEIWIINKRKLPALQDQITALSGVDIGELNEIIVSHAMTLSNLSKQIDTLSKKQTSQEEEIKALKSSTTSLSQETSAINNSITQINATLTSISSTLDLHTTKLATIQTTLQNHSQSISKNEGDIKTNQANISSINTTLASHSLTLDNLQTQINTLTSQISQHTTDIENLTNSLSSISSRVQTLEEDMAGVKTRVGNLETQVEEQDSSLTSINSSITQINTTLTQTQTTANQALALAQEVKDSGTSGGTSSGGGSAPACLSGELLFDMRSEDENINHGFTSGLHAKDRLTLNFSAYRFLKIYTLFMTTVETQVIIDITNKKGSQFTATAWRGNDYLELIRIRIPATLKYVYFENYASICLDGISELITVGDTNTKNNYTIFRIEGIV